MEKFFLYENEYCKFLKIKNFKKIMKREEFDNRIIVKDIEVKEKKNFVFDIVEDLVFFICGMCFLRFLMF